MKKLTNNFVLVFVLLSCCSITYAINPNATSSNQLISSNDLASFSISELGTMSAGQFLALTPDRISEQTGQKMKFKHKVALKLTQRAIQKQLKQGKELSFEEANYDFSIGGFLLGFFLGLIGVLIAALAFPKNVLKSSLIGLLCVVIAIAIGLVL